MLSTNVQLLRSRPAEPALAEADRKTFQAATRQLPSGVCVLTLGVGEERTGLTATSLSSLSAEPPRLLRLRELRVMELPGIRTLRRLRRQCSCSGPARIRRTLRCRSC